MNTHIDPRELKRCAYTNIRRVDRLVARFYDRMLAPAGVSAAQFALLATLVAAAPVTVNRLAKILVMDRTTLTRNLSLLNRRQFIRYQEGTDRRMRMIFLTREGQEAFDATLPLWRQGQGKIERDFGNERFESLLAELAAIVELVR
ncbi:MAG TPA: MarR family winged helix-turn-helix transcriptional regulator [Ktedonobacteraceae bacterium]